MRGLDTDEFVLTTVPGNCPPCRRLKLDASANMVVGLAGRERQRYGESRTVA
jgi:hypothetical protein